MRYKKKKSKLRMTSRRDLIMEELSNKENEFFNIVDRCNVPAVKLFLESNQIDLNKKNYQGITPLHLAIKNDCYPLVDLFLSYENVQLGDLKLFAIAHDNLSMFKHLIEYENDAIMGRRYIEGIKLNYSEDSEEYPNFITPLLLAAQCGRYEMIEYLLSCGDKLERPHPSKCMCISRCRPMMESMDIISIGCERLNVYAAISNPAYLCCTSSDPVLKCFQLHHELLECGEVDQVYKNVYSEMAYKVRQFAVEMIVNCRTSDEVKVILKNSNGCSFKSDFIYPRLITAMDYKQKEFVAHTTIQQVLESAWIGDWIEWKGYSFQRKCLYPFQRLICMPLTVLKGLSSNYLNTNQLQNELPINRMFDNLVMYTVFLILLFYQSNLDKFDMHRGAPDTTIKWFIVLFVLSYIAETLNLRMLQGPKRYFKDLWNIFDAIKLLLFIMSFAFWIFAEIQASWVDPNLDRKYWPWYDPQLLGEALFALGTVMAFMRLLFLCHLNYYIGPMQISLGKVLNDFSKFMTFLIIIIVAFTTGLGTLYSYYLGMSQKDQETEKMSVQEDSFISISNTFKTLFWGIFCMTSLEAPEVVLANDDNNDVRQHYFTQFVGYMLFAVFEVLMVIVMINMLIAAMSDTFQRVVDNAEYEWLFGRTKVYVNYMLIDNLPPPFNLLSFIRFLIQKLWSQENKNINAENENLINNEEHKFQQLIKELVQRYFMQQA
ncbi:short transient receptor potential channel 4-like [Daktulosphaira vitifoliae]|uniref:short transient receptor potential channel 4-like n=1 Tax=Daktulosphaira vitifoliae TaxID=58002 RepID=UPI0021A97F10|nr:short transient receptor potential channel 4-like [Daktulosphaira vitifoliae]